MAVNPTSSQKTIEQIIAKTAENAKDRKVGGELGKDDFLNLLVTQLRYQDPLNPTDDKAFIGQMAQFSSLEQMQNMNGALSSSKAFSLIGKHITASIKDATTQETKEVEGDVASVKMDEGKYYLVVNGQDVLLDDVTDVTEGFRSQSSNISQYTNLIGFNADGCVYDSKTSNIVKVNGVVKSIEKGTYEDYAVMDGVNVEISDIVTNAPSTDPTFVKNYLAANKGKEVTVTVVNRATNQKVPVTATLKDYNIAADGKITATLDQLGVPVESITNIVPVQQESSEETLLKQILAKLPDLAK